jgi:hypothetical protein
MHGSNNELLHEFFKLQKKYIDNEVFKILNIAEAKPKY